ncbi:MAG: DUF29 domain-containing protein [Elainellaceae cyanobacterium]
MTVLYESDFYDWLQTQASYLKKQKWEQLDIEHLVEEIEALGRQERRELTHRLGVLLGHLLKWQFQPAYRSHSWESTLREQRRQIQRLLAQSPSLKPYLPDALLEAYEDGLDLAVRETNQPYDLFPASCPYSLDQVLRPDFLPPESSL